MRKFSQFFIASAIAVSLMTPALAISTKYRSLSESLVTRAQAALAGTDVAQADELVNLALTANPANAEAYILKARVQQQNGDNAEALRLVTVGLEIDPTNASGRALQTRLAADTEDFDLADKALKQYRAVCDTACGEAAALGQLINDKRTQAASREN